MRVESSLKSIAPRGRTWRNGAGGRRRTSPNDRAGQKREKRKRSVRACPRGETYRNPSFCDWAAHRPFSHFQRGRSPGHRAASCKPFRPRTLLGGAQDDRRDGPHANMSGKAPSWRLGAVFELVYAMRGLSLPLCAALARGAALRPAFAPVCRTGLLRGVVSPDDTGGAKPPAEPPRLMLLSSGLTTPELEATFRGMLHEAGAGADPCITMVVTGQEEIETLILTLTLTRILTQPQP